MSEPASTTLGSIHPLDVSILCIILVSTLLVGIYASLVSNDVNIKQLLLFSKAKLPSEDTKGQVEMAELGTSTNPLYTSEGKSDTTKEHHKSQLLTSHPSSAEVTQTGNVDEHKAANFFLADRQMGFMFVGASLFASNIGSEHFVGQAGEGARRGLAVAMFEWYAAVLLLLLGWVFTPLYRRADITTTPQFMQLRFSPGCRHYLSVLTCLMYVLTKMSASIYGGAVILTAALGWDLYLSAGACIILSALYTVFGGLRAVMYTDLLQTVIFVAGGMVVLVVCLHEVGGIGGLQRKLNEQGKHDHWHLWKPASDDDYPWTGMLIGQPIASLWYWCMDQDLVQRVLSAKDGVHAKAGCIMASLLKMLPPFLMVVPGMVAAVLYDMEDMTDKAYPVLLTSVVPPGVVGLMIASIMCAMMSSLDSVFNAGSTVVTYDMYKVLYPDASDATLEWVGRIATVTFAILSFLWIPVLSSGTGMFRQLVEFQGYLTPPVGIVLLIGVCWKRANGSGALAGLLLGGALGLTRLIMSVSLEDGHLKNLPLFLYHIFTTNFLHFSILLWVTAAVSCVGVSLCTPPPTNLEAIDKLTIRWSEVFAVSVDEAIYSNWVRRGLLIGASSVIVLTLSLWIAFA